jgi:hypothetical protein
MPESEGSDQVSIQEFYDHAFEYACTTQRFDRMVPGQIGVARMCFITYPGKIYFWSGEGADLTSYSWHHYYYTLFQSGQSQVWPNVVAADFVTDQIGWRQLDRSGGFFEIQRTSDGGITWNMVSRVSWVAQLDFTSELEGWAIARPAQGQFLPLFMDSSYMNLTTTALGVTSEKLFPAPWLRPDFFGESLLMHTKDGGFSWEIVLPIIGP